MKHAITHRRFIRIGVLWGDCGVLRRSVASCGFQADPTQPYGKLQRTADLLLQSKNAPPTSVCANNDVVCSRRRQVSEGHVWSGTTIFRLLFKDWAGDVNVVRNKVGENINEARRWLARKFVSMVLRIRHRFAFIIWVDITQNYCFSPLFNKKTTLLKTFTTKHKQWIEGALFGAS